MGLHWRMLGGIGLLIMATSAWLTVAPAARADNLGGQYTICAQLVSFYEPGPTQGGIVVHGIGPGLYTPEDRVGHHFLFAAGATLEPALSERLAAIAEEDAFTCLFITSGRYIDTIALVPTADVCGQISLDRDGFWTLNSSDWLYPRQLLGDAATTVAGDAPLAGLLAQAGGAPSVCLHFELTESGRLNRIGVDASLEFCAPLQRGVDSGIGGVDVPAALLPAPVPDALRFLAERRVEGCAALKVVDTRVVAATIDASDNVCGYVTENEADSVAIDGQAIPASLLRPDQRDLLAASATACLAVEVAAGGVTATLHETVARTPPPAEAPSAAATPAGTVESPAPGTPATAPGDPIAAAPPGTGMAVVAGVLVAVATLIGASLLVARGRRRAAAGTDELTDGGSLRRAELPRPATAPMPTGPQESPQRLTNREREVLQMVVEGLSNRQIGDALYISESTAGVHVSNIMGKLGAANRTEAAARARRLGLLSGDGPPGSGGRPH